MKEFRPALAFPMTTDQKARLTVALRDKETLEPHSLRSVSGLSHADAVLLMFQLHEAGLVDLGLRVFEAQTGNAILDIPYGRGFLALPYRVPHREDPISDPDDLRYGLIVSAREEFKIT